MDRFTVASIDCEYPVTIEITMVQIIDVIADRRLLELQQQQ
jgi:hypothetical protein